jgi:serine/threonine protein kinase
MKDLRARNVLLAADAPRLSDLGAVCFLEAARPGSGMPPASTTAPSGDPEYMTPEAFTEGHLDDLGEGADVYTLGCTAYELRHAVSSPPFRETDERLREQHQHLSAPPLGATYANVARGIARYLEECHGSI